MENVVLTEDEVEFCERFADEHGLGALLDHLGLDGLGNDHRDSLAAQRTRERELDDRFGRVEVSLLLGGEAHYLASEIFSVLDLSDEPLPPDKMCSDAREAYRKAMEKTEKTLSLYAWQGMLEALSEGPGAS